MKTRILKIALAILILFGFFWLWKTIFYDSAFDKKNPLNPDNVKTQTFLIDNEHDTIVIGQNGTIIIINKNSFADCNNIEITDKVTIKLKEVLSKSDFVLAGLSTTSNGKILETGGMIYLNAYYNNRPLLIRDSTSLGIIMPNYSDRKDMKLFQGKMINNQINWINPTSILNNQDTIYKILFGERWDPDEYTFEQGVLMDLIEVDILASPNKKNINYDSILLVLIEEERIERKYYADLISIFETQVLGWLNIDRFVEEYRTNDVNFNVSVSNAQSFNSVYVKLIFLDLQIGLTGYLLKDNIFIFGKQGTSEVNLPIGEKAIVIVTAFKKRTPFFGSHNLTIKENQNIKIEISETTLDDLKQIINDKF